MRRGSRGERRNLAADMKFSTAYTQVNTLIWLSFDWTAGFHRHMHARFQLIKMDNLPVTLVEVLLHTINTPLVRL